MLEVYEPSRNYWVLVRCMTYNHSEFIGETLNGFTSQKTSFPFVCIVMDDASTDGEQLVLDKWMQTECLMEEAKHIELNLSSVIIVPHKVNKNCTMAFYLLKKNLFKVGGKGKLFEPWRKHCQYEAICEGDDYWTDECKLQRQVDFLNKHKQYSMTAENGLVINNILGNSYPFSDKPVRDIKTMEEMIHGRKFPTAGVLMRMSPLIEMYKQIEAPHDTFIWCWMFTKGKIHYDNVISSVYRRGYQGICEGTEHYLFGKQCEEWDLNLKKHFNISKRFIFFDIASNYKYTCHRALQNKQYRSASKSFLKMVFFCVKSLIAVKKE